MRRRGMDRSRRRVASVHFSVDLLTGIVREPDVLVCGLGVEGTAKAYAQAAVYLNRIRRAIKGARR